MSFSDSQKSALLRYFSNGMVGTGNQFNTQIAAAVAETGLRERQVKVRLHFAIEIYRYTLSAHID